MSGASSSSSNHTAAQPGGPTNKGQYVSVELKYLDEAGAPVVEPMPTYQVPSRPQEVWVEAVTGKAYGVFVRNLSREDLCFKLLVDGQTVTTRCVHPGRVADITSVVTSSRTIGNSVTEIRGSLVFKSAEIAEETTLDRHAADAGKEDKLGCIEIEVWNTVITEPRPVHQTVVNESSRLSLGGAVSADVGKKKGFAKTATGVGGLKTEKTYLASQWTSKYCFGQTRYETVAVRYASRALLLLMGTPPALFMNNDQNQTSVDLTEEDDKAKARPSKRQRSTEPSTKTEPPGDEAQKAKAVKEEPRPGTLTMEDDDDVVDLTL